MRVVEGKCVNLGNTVVLDFEKGNIRYHTKTLNVVLPFIVYIPLGGDGVKYNNIMIEGTEQEFNNLSRIVDNPLKLGVDSFGTQMGVGDRVLVYGVAGNNRIVLPGLFLGDTIYTPQGFKKASYYICVEGMKIAQAVEKRFMQLIKHYENLVYAMSDYMTSGVGPEIGDTYKHTADSYRMYIGKVSVDSGKTGKPVEKFGYLVLKDTRIGCDAIIQVIKKNAAPVGVDFNIYEAFKLTDTKIEYFSRPNFYTKETGVLILKDTTKDFLLGKLIEEVGRKYHVIRNG